MKYDGDKSVEQVLREGGYYDKSPPETVATIIEHAESCEARATLAEGSLRRIDGALTRFLLHRGDCWDWCIEDGDLGTGCSELQRALRLSRGK